MERTLPDFSNMWALAPASRDVVVKSLQPFIPGSQIAHLLEEDQGSMAFCVAFLVKTVGF